MSHPDRAVRPAPAIPEVTAPEVTASPRVAGSWCVHVPEDLVVLEMNVASVARGPRYGCGGYGVPDRLLGTVCREALDAGVTVTLAPRGAQ